MDTYSAAHVARVLGTTVPRVVRAAERLGLEGRRTSGRRWALTATMVDRLARELGCTSSIDGLTGSEVKVLAALARAPLGLASVRAVGREAGVSPTAASNALRSLEAKELVDRERTTIAAGRARSAELLHGNRSAPAWIELSPQLATVRPPARTRGRPSTVPPRLRHLFWNTAPEQLDVGNAGPYIARRLLTSGDLEGLAWGADALLASDWRQAAEARGLEPRRRALARNLAAAA